MTTTPDLAAANAAILAVYERIGQRIRFLREQRSITQATLAAAVGLSRGSLANIEAGRQRTPVHILIAVAQGFGIAPALLFDPAAEMPRLGVPLPPGTERLKASLTAARNEISALLAALSTDGESP